jgi:hypothetical protein
LQKLKRAAALDRRVLLASATSALVCENGETQLVYLSIAQADIALHGGSTFVCG